MASHMLDTNHLLLQYAAGRLSYAESLMIASHLALNPSARHKLSVYEKMGGQLIDDLEPSALSHNCLDAVLKSIDCGDHGHDCVEPVSYQNSPLPDGLALPKVLTNLLAKSCVAKASCWKRISDGIDIFEFSLPKTAENEAKHILRLMRLKAGYQTPEHKHQGTEYTLVLDGAFEDCYGRYGVGDVAIIDHELHSHSPKACPERGCICLTLTSQPLRFTNPVVRLLNVFWKI